MKIRATGGVYVLLVAALLLLSLVFCGAKPRLVPPAALPSTSNVVNVHRAGTVNNYQGGILTPKAREDLLRLTADQDARLKEMMRK